MPDLSIDFGTVLYFTENRAIQTSNNTLDPISWDVPGSPSDVEAYATMLTYSELTTARLELLVRGSGSSASETAYVFMGNRNTAEFEIGKYVAGVYTTLATESLNRFTARTWWHMRFRVVGSTLQGKYWRRGEEEPDGYQLETTDSDISGGGWVGWQGGANTSYLENIGVGVSGAAAPDEIDEIDTGQYFTDLTENASTGVEATNWTKRWGTALNQFIVISSTSQLGYVAPPLGWNTWWMDRHEYKVLTVTGATNDKALVHSSTSSSTSDNVCLAYVDGGRWGDFDVNIRALTSNELFPIRFFFRADGFVGSETGYFVELAKVGATGDTFRLRRYDEGTLSTIVSAVFAWEDDVFYKIRIYALGPIITAKVWLDSEDEPLEWNIEIADGEIIPGFFGVGSTSNSVQPAWDVLEFTFSLEGECGTTDEPEGIQNNMLSLLDERTHHLCTCWVIERTDGEVLYFTDHDAPLLVEFPVDSGDEQTFLPAGGVNASARQRKGSLEIDNLEHTGVLTSDAITFDDLRAGKYRDAKVTELLVDWRFPWMGKFAIYVYYVDETRAGDSLWTAQLSGLTRLLRANIGRVHSKLCRFTLGDEDCTIDLEPLTESGTVSAVTTARRVFEASDIPTAPTTIGGSGNAWYDFGVITWTSGANDGLTSEVKGYLNADREFSLQLSAPFDIEVGDTFDVTPGCNKIHDSHCGPKYDNIINFGGQPFIRGTAAMLVTPSRPLTSAGGKGRFTHVSVDGQRLKRTPS